MMRKRLLAGNWKMNKTSAEARRFAEELGRMSSAFSATADYTLCVPFTSLYVLKVMLPVHVCLGAQNVHPHASGPFTGEISMSMLMEFGVHYVILGHSERRAMFAETDTFIAEKVGSVLASGGTPILCVGESAAQKAAMQTESVVLAQLEAGFACTSIEDARRVVVAYEPVWAIGSGSTPSPTDAEHVISTIREKIASMYGTTLSEHIRILYGGSVNSNNLASFVAKPNIDGALVGGASLDAVSFASLARALVEGGSV